MILYLGEAGARTSGRAPPDRRIVDTADGKKKKTSVSVLACMSPPPRPTAHSRIVLCLSHMVVSGGWRGIAIAQINDSRSTQNGVFLARGHGEQERARD